MEEKFPAVLLFKSYLSTSIDVQMKIYRENFAFLVFRILELFTCKVYIFLRK